MSPRERMNDFLPNSAFDLFGNPDVNVLPELPPTTANLLSAYGNQKMADEWQALFDSVQLAVTAWLPRGRIRNGGTGLARAHARAMLMGIVALDIAHWLNMLVNSVLSDAEIYQFGRQADQVLFPAPDAAVCATMGKLDESKWSMTPSDTDATQAKLTAIFTNAAVTWCRMRCADMSVTAYMPHPGITFDGKRMAEGTTLTDESCTNMDNVVVAVCMFPGVAHYTFDGRASLIWSATVATKVQEEVQPDKSLLQLAAVTTKLQIGVGSDQSLIRSVAVMAKVPESVQPDPPQIQSVAVMTKAYEGMAPDQDRIQLTETAAKVLEALRPGESDIPSAYGNAVIEMTAADEY
ncbi:hypothetical protein GGF31_007019 [Allomyces arbusculus]|nr:hypothetical protein GGF31_007019 [Allomyces arbusculus]